MGKRFARKPWRTRSVWIKNHGPVPRDENGSSFDIHHKDRNPENDNPDNLEALSMADHYVVHAEAGEWSAAWCIAKRMKLTSQQKQKIRDDVSAGMRGKSHSWGHKISASRMGIKFSEIHLKNLSLSHVGNRHSVETRAKMSASQKLRPAPSEETRRKRSDKRRGMKFSPEWCANIGKSKKGKTLWPNGRSPETIAKTLATKALKNNMTPDRISSIRDLYAAGNHSWNSLAKDFGLSKRTIGRIVKVEYGDTR